VGTILLYALAAAVYPQLLAVVVIILTRPDPRRLLWTCYLASLAMSVGSGLAIFAAFRDHETVAGVSSQRLGPAAYLVVGALAVLLAAAMATSRGRAVLARARPASRRSGTADRDARTTDRDARATDASQPNAMRMRARAEHALSEGSLLIAALVGVLLAVPGPFDLLALGHLARNGDTILAALGVLIVFALVKFLLIELPIAGYVIDPDGTAARVNRFATWMKENKLMATAAIVAIVGAVLVVEGLSRLG
jgi:hypothetical protein